MSEQKQLFLLPMPIAETELNYFVPNNVIKLYSEMNAFVVENAKTARQFLKSVDKSIDFNVIEIFELDKFEPKKQKQDLTEFLLKYSKIGLLSEAGMPCIADPGNLAVQCAHQLGIKVKPTVGPSSILLALIASGFNGQNFAFNGYLPIKTEDRTKSIKNIINLAQSGTQLFIEAPYRNQKTLEFLLQALPKNYQLLIAFDLTGINETIVVKTIQKWIETPINLEKHPCIFGISGEVF